LNQMRKGRRRIRFLRHEPGGGTKRGKRKGGGVPDKRLAARGRKSCLAAPALDRAGIRLEHRNKQKQLKRREKKEGKEGEEGGLGGRKVAVGSTYKQPLSWCPRLCGEIHAADRSEGKPPQKEGRRKGRGDGGA